MVKRESWITKMERYLNPERDGTDVMSTRSRLHVPVPVVVEAAGLLRFLMLLSAQSWQLCLVELGGGLILLAKPRERALAS
jgi:hypothetical protein